MGAVLGLKQNAWNAGTPEQHEVMEVLDADLELGHSLQGSVGAVGWRLHLSGRFQYGKMAYFGCLCANQVEIFALWDPPKDDGGNIIQDQMRTELKVLLEDPARIHPLVKWGDMIVPPGTENVWQYILDQQGTPAFCQMWNEKPAGFVPAGGV